MSHREIAPFAVRAIGRRKLHGESPGEVIRIERREIHGQMVDVKILAPGCAQDPIDAQKIGTGRKSGVTRQIGDGYNEEPVIPQVMNWKTKPIDPQIHRRSLKDKMGVISKRRKRNLRNGADPSA